MSHHLKSPLTAAVGAVVVGLVAQSALAVGVPVVNAGMELNQGGALTEGQDRYYRSNDVTEAWKYWAATANGATVRGWNPTTTDIAEGSYDQGWNGNAPEGNSVLVVATRYNDDRTEIIDMNGDSIADLNFTGVRNFEAAAQRLSSTFDPTAKYTLSARVGQLASNSLNSTTITEQFSGYNVSLMAGGFSSAGYTSPPVGSPAGTPGTPGAVSSFNGWIAGSSLIAEDANTQSVPDNYVSGGASTGEGGWTISSVAYVPNPSSQAAMNALATQNLVIRLAALEAADHSTNSYVAFDQVVLTKIVAGDANEDDLVNGTDLALLAASFGLSGQSWATGDFSGDGSINGTDLALLAANFGFDANNLSAPVGISLAEANRMLAAIPEPTSVALFGLVGLGAMNKRRRK